MQKKQEREAEHCIDFTVTVIAFIQSLENTFSMNDMTFAFNISLPDFGHSFNFWNKKEIPALCTASISDGLYEKLLIMIFDDFDDDADAKVVWWVSRKGATLNW